MRCGPVLTQVADVASELLERRGQAFRVGGDFGGVQHEGHTVDLLPQARLLHVANSLGSIHRLIWPELIKQGSLCWVFPWQRLRNSSPELRGNLFTKVCSSRRFAVLTLCPSGTKPLMTDRMSWREGPVMAPSPRPMVSHSTRLLGCSLLRSWILKNCSWAQHGG